MEKNINNKLYDAFMNDDYTKMNKYLSNGANPNIYDNKLYKYAVSNDDIDLLKLLLKYNESCIFDDKSIVTLACAYNAVDCLHNLNTIINLENYKKTATYTILKRIICV